MRLSDILSKPPTLDFKQVEGFLDNKKLKTGKQKKLNGCTVALNYFCKKCLDVRTFYSCSDLFCIGIDEHLISIDCVLNCKCKTSIQMWFLLDCMDDISGNAPEIRILKRCEKLSNSAVHDTDRYGEFTGLLEKSQHAYRENLGAGAMIYLRKIFEQITHRTAMAQGIEYLNVHGKPKPFKNVLEKVDEKSHIIPWEFSANGYKLFGELSDIIHGEYDEETALKKYESLHRLVIGILDNVKQNQELMQAINALGWNEGGSDDE